MPFSGTALDSPNKWRSTFPMSPVVDETQTRSGHWLGIGAYCIYAWNCIHHWKWHLRHNTEYSNITIHTMSYYQPWEVMQSPLSTCPSLSNLSFQPTDLWPWCFACVAHMAHKGLKLKVTGQGQDAVGLTSILDQEQFSCFIFLSAHDDVVFYRMKTSQSNTWMAQQWQQRLGQATY